MFRIDTENMLSVCAIYGCPVQQHGAFGLWNVWSVACLNATSMGPFSDAYEDAYIEALR